MILPQTFYAQETVRVAKHLLGCYLVHLEGEATTLGRIVETEAYAGQIDRASHAWNGRRTGRTKIMYEHGGHAYVYLCYGIHHLFNIVTNVKDVPHAILIRAIYPVQGKKLMMKRRKKKVADLKFTIGPGSISEALNKVYVPAALINVRTPSSVKKSRPLRGGRALAFCPVNNSL